MGLINPYVGKTGTYIPDNVKMPVPPAHFLAPIHDYDDKLVILPSRQQPYTYVIARRRQLTAGLKFMKVDEDTPVDTKMCIENDCIPVCRMFQHGTSWDPQPILAKFRARDMWAHGGPEKVNELLLAQEAAEKAKTRAATRDDLYNRSGDGWRTYQRRTGQRVLGVPLTPQSEQRDSKAPLVVS
jgi:hypothetical protein